MTVAAAELEQLRQVRDELAALRRRRRALMLAAAAAGASQTAIADALNVSRQSIHAQLNRKDREDAHTDRPPDA